MNAKQQKRQHLVAVTVEEQAQLALATIATADKLQALAKGSETILAITNQAGLDQCHGARMVLKNTRVDIEKRGKAVRAEINLYRDAVTAEERRLVGIIEPEETRLEKLQREYEEAIARKKREAEEAEERRVAGIQALITEFDTFLSFVPGITSSENIERRIADLTAVKIDSRFGEFWEQASSHRAYVLTALGDLCHSAKVRENQERQAAAEREELARKQKEVDERLAQVAAREAAIAAREAQAKQPAPPVLTEVVKPLEPELRYDSLEPRIAENRPSLTLEDVAYAVMDKHEMLFADAIAAVLKFLDDYRASPVCPR